MMTLVPEAETEVQTWLQALVVEEASKPTDPLFIPPGAAINVVAALIANFHQIFRCG